MAKIPRTRTSTPSRPVDAHGAKVAVGAPAPMCQYAGCHRRAALNYRDAKTGLRVFRAWCGPHRPVYGRTRWPDRQAMPRPYRWDPKGDGWPEDVKCPFCERKREPLKGGGMRRTCRLCRAKCAAICGSK